MRSVAILFFASTLITHSSSTDATIPSIQEHEIAAVGRLIWERECNGRTDALIHWNEGEEFPSLGIGHFIWYPAHTQKLFDETFPALINYLCNHGVPIPEWLNAAIISGCPWESRLAFLKAQKSDLRLQELLLFLQDTIDLQGHFIVDLFYQLIPRALEKVAEEKRDKIKRHFMSLASSRKGLYALIDYAHFKGIGLTEKESYNGIGWGLLHVLDAIPQQENDDNILSLFIDAAKNTLLLRVQNSPPNRNEMRWLQGWINRIDRYL